MKELFRKLSNILSSAKEGRLTYQHPGPEAHEAVEAPKGTPTPTPEKNPREAGKKALEFISPEQQEMVDKGKEWLKKYNDAQANGENPFTKHEVSTGSGLNWDSPEAFVRGGLLKDYPHDGTRVVKNSPVVLARLFPEPTQPSEAAGTMIATKEPKKHMPK
jgi:hypothetical protein